MVSWWFACLDTKLCLRDHVRLLIPPHLFGHATQYGFPSLMYATYRFLCRRRDDWLAAFGVYLSCRMASRSSCTFNVSCVSFAAIGFESSSFKANKFGLGAVFLSCAVLELQKTVFFGNRIQNTSWSVNQPMVPYWSQGISVPISAQFDCLPFWSFQRNIKNIPIILTLCAWWMQLQYTVITAVHRDQP